MPSGPGMHSFGERRPFLPLDVASPRRYDCANMEIVQPKAVVEARLFQEYSVIR
jgi:hypothetical protein